MGHRPGVDFSALCLYGGDIERVTRCVLRFALGDMRDSDSLSSKSLTTFCTSLMVARSDLSSYFDACFAALFSNLCAFCRLIMRGYYHTGTTHSAIRKRRVMMVIAKTPGTGHYHPDGF